MTMLLTATDIEQTADAIADWQLPDGMIPWFPGGHADPWNHVEAAMALAVADRVSEAERAYDWLVGLQRPMEAGSSTTRTVLSSRTSSMPT